MTVNKLSILTLVSNVLIIIGAGHGIAFLGICELAVLFVRNNPSDYISVYEKNLTLVSILSILGQSLLVVNMFLKRKLVLFFALLTLWIAVGILVKDLFENSVARLSFFSSIPFLVLSVILFQRKFKEASTLKNHQTL